MQEKIEALVRQVVVDYLNKQSLTKSEQKDEVHLFVLLDKHPFPISGSNWEAIYQITKEHQTTFCAPEGLEIPSEINSKHILLCKNNQEVIQEEMEKSSMLILVNSQFSNLTKLALSIDDTLGMWIILQMQLSGKKIVFASDFLSISGKQMVTAPHLVSERIQSYIRQLQQEKVQFVSLSHMNKWLNTYLDEQNHQRHIVLAKHIEKVANEGKKELEVPKGSLITPMCKDLARELGVSIKQKE